MSKILLTHLPYLPNLSFWQGVAQHESVHLERQEHYLKGSSRNRCHIATSNGILRLSVPLQQGKNQQQNIVDTRIANETFWQRQHWRSICSAYGSAPFWTHYAPYFEPFYHKKYEFLWDWNLDLFHQTAKLLALKQPILLTESYIKTPNTTLITDLRGDKTDALPMPLPYPQVFSATQGFLEQVSVIDALFCYGKTAITHCI